MHILIEPGITLPLLGEDSLARIRAAAGANTVITQTTERDEMIALAPDIEVLFGVIYEDVLAGAAKLSWVHATGSGVDDFLFPAFRDSDIILTSEKGLVGSHLADHAMGLLLALTRRIGAALRDGPDCWDNRLVYRREEIELQDLTMGIVGYGGTGKAIAQRARGFDMRILAVDVNPDAVRDDGVDVKPLSELPELLGVSDVVAIGLPLSAQTENLFNHRVIAQMKPGAILLNVTRGEIIEPVALLEALRCGHLGGAGLDVTWQEPLAKDDPLWNEPNAVLTPHTAGASQYRLARNLGRFIDNIGHFRRGEPMVGLVDKLAGF